MNIKMKLVAVSTAIAISGAVAAVPFFASADANSDLIAQLQAQIAALQKQLSALSGSSAAPAAPGSCSFSHDLKVGSRGDDVKCLQGVLGVSPQSGYFGALTKAAVVKWQKSAGVTPAAGYFGAKSRAAYAASAKGGTTSGAATSGGSTSGGTVSVPAGSGLTVTAPATQPASTLAPGSAARIPTVQVTLTASSDGDVTVNSLTAQRTGLANDSDIDSVLLLDQNGTQIGLSKTLNSNHQVVFNQPFVVKAGTSKAITVAVNMIASPTGAGQIFSFAVNAIDAGSAKVNGTLPIQGNGMTINTTLTLGTVTMSIGSLDPGAANSKNVGTKGYYFASVKASVGSAEDVTFSQMSFNQAGSAAGTDVANIVINAGGKDYPAVLSSDGKYYAATFSPGIVVTKGNSMEFSVKGDIVNGSARTVDMNIQRKSDIVVMGNTYGYNIIVGGGSSGAASAGAFSSNQEPFFNAYAATINSGSMLVSSSNTVPSGNIPVSVTDTTLGAFLIDVKGEPIQVSSWTLNFNFTGTGTSSNLTALKLYDSNGGIVAGPKDPASGIVTWTDSWTAPVGQNVYLVKGKLSTTFANNDTVQVAVNPGSLVTAKGSVTGLAITPTPTSYITANAQTVKAAALSFSVSATPFAQNVVRGVNGFKFATYIFDASQSGEDIRLTSVQLRDTLSAAAVGNEVNSCVLYDGANALNTGSDVQNPSAPSGTTNDLTFTLTNNLIIPKGTVKQVDLKCNISSAATVNSTHAWGTNAGTSNINAVGASTASTVTPTITTSTGSTMTVLGNGSFTVVQDASAPVSSIVLAGKTNVPMNVLKYHASNEAINITQLTLNYSSSTASTSDFVKATLWDGATQIGTAVWASGAQNATSSFTAPFVVPKDGDRLLTVMADVGSVDVVASSTGGRLLSVNYSGVSSSTGVGQGSGASLGSSSANDANGNTMQIMKSVPTVAKLAIPTTSLPQTSGSLYRFSVSADPAGPVALYKVTFLVSSSSVSATTSSFNLYGYSDSGFASAAYQNNPLYPRAVGCSGESVLETYTACNTSGTTLGSGFASSSVATSSRVVFFFAPSTNVASNTEAIIIPAGTTRYFELKGNITNPGSGTGNSLSISLAGDAQRPLQNAGNSGQAAGVNTGLGPQRFIANYGQGRLATAAEISMESDRNNFVWSPMSTSTSLTGATSTTDWTNGTNVPGLPSTGLSANTFSN